jgi:hypothetical protein
VVSVTDPYIRILSFLGRSRYFSIKLLLSCTHEAEWTPFQTHCFFSGSAGNRTRASGSIIIIRKRFCYSNEPEFVFSREISSGYSCETS